MQMRAGQSCQRNHLGMCQIKKLITRPLNRTNKHQNLLHQHQTALVCVPSSLFCFVLFSSPIQLAWQNRKTPSSHTRTGWHQRGYLQALHGCVSGCHFGCALPGAILWHRIFCLLSSHQGGGEGDSCGKRDSRRGRCYPGARNGWREGIQAHGRRNCQLGQESEALCQ